MSTSFLGFDAGVSLGASGLSLVAQTFCLDVIWLISSAGALLGLLGIVGGRQGRPRVA